MKERQQNSASYPLPFLLVLSSDNNTGAAGLLPTGAFSGGSGTGAAGYFTTNGAGVINAFVLTSGGSGYTGTPTLTITSPTLGSGSGLTIGTITVTSNVVTNVAISAGGTGYGPTVTLSKNGGAFASPAGAVSEFGNGWYQVAGNSTDTGTLGPLVLHVAASGVTPPTDSLYTVVGYNPFDSVRLGLTALPSANAGASGGLIEIGTGSGQINPDGLGNVKVSSGTGAGQLSLSSGVIAANVTQLLGTTSAGAAGYVGIDWSAIHSATSAQSLSGTTIATGQVVASVTAGVTVSTNNDKTGYSLTQGFPANFAALGITVGGKISEVALVDSLTTYTGNTPQTGDAYTLLSSGSYGNAALRTAINAIPTNPYTGTPPTAAQIRQEIDNNSTQLATAVDLLAADRVIDTSTDPTQYHEVFYVSGSSTVLMTKRLFDVAGNKLNTTTTVVGQAKQ